MEMENECSLMELIRDSHNLKPRHRQCVATIGNFDGVHLGHQAVLKQLTEQAARLDLPSVVIILEPQPNEFFKGSDAAARLTRLREKLQLFKSYSIDRVLCLVFNANLSAMPARDFIEKILVDGLDVRYLVVGDDFRFGHKRQGDFAMLVEAGKEHDFPVVNMQTYHLDGERVSSTRIRSALAEGDLALAEKLLGRPYSMTGRIAHGDKRGRTIGFPTANLHLHRRRSPILGVYAVEMLGIEGEPVAGIANVGTRPTVDGSKTLLEVHLFDYEGDLYGCYVQVNFLQKIRDEMKFDSFPQLQQQIQQDVTQARDWFKHVSRRN
jgi:riboflavin kinase/FMN adenylyltransferase